MRFFLFIYYAELNLKIERLFIGAKLVRLTTAMLQCCFFLLRKQYHVHSQSGNTGLVILILRLVHEFRTNK